MKGGTGKTKWKLTVKLERTLSDELIARIYIKVQPFANATLNTDCFERFQIQLLAADICNIRWLFSTNLPQLKIKPTLKSIIVQSIPAISSTRIGSFPVYVFLIEYWIVTIANYKNNLTNSKDLKQQFRLNIVCN